MAESQPVLRGAAPGASGEAGRAVAGCGAGADVEELVDEERVYCVTRDPGDLRTIRGLLAVVAALVAADVVLAVCVVAFMMRKPERTVVVRDQAGNVTQIDSQKLGGAADVRVEQDAPDRADMIFLGRELARLMHEVDMKRRRFDLQRVVGAMTPGAADQYSRIMTERGILRQQKDEQWDATWREQVFGIDPSDRSGMTVEIIGTQAVRRTVGGQERGDAFQHSLKFKLAVDKNGRQDYNMRSGFVVREFQDNPINETHAK